MEVSSWENHLFLWAIYTMAMLVTHSQRVIIFIVNLNGYITMGYNGITIYWYNHTMGYNGYITIGFFNGG